MKEHPIIFKGEMVKAILEGRKTMTRRLIKPQPCEGDWLRKFHLEQWISECPYGEIGDRLWVRETYVSTTDGKSPTVVLYKATDEECLQGVEGLKWCPSIFMPRWASRITLEITNIRVEKVQEITHKDALNEGVHYDVSKADGSPLQRFQSLWNSINGKGAWDSNPYVWVIEFKKI